VGGGSFRATSVQNGPQVNTTHSQHGPFSVFENLEFNADGDMFYLRHLDLSTQWRSIYLSSGFPLCGIVSE
jgi:hypothetical protein